MTHRLRDKQQLNVIHSCRTWLHRTENWIYTQIAHMPESVRSHVVCGNTKNLEEYSVPSLYVFPDISRLRYFLRYGLPEFCIHRRPAFIAWIAKRESGSILHSHFGVVGWHDIKAAKQVGLKHVVSFYGVDASQAPKSYPIWLDRYLELFDHVDCVLCEGPHIVKCLTGLGCPSEKVIVHHIGVRLEKYEFRIRRPNNHIRLMVCGRFIEKKGIPFAIEALKRVISKTKADVHLTIVGDSDSEGSLTDEKRKILNSIEKNGVASAVTITGYIPHNELMQLVYDHHILLAPSVHASDGDAEGGFPVILTEALATGMPVVAFNHCDIPEIIQNGITGFMVPERDVDALAEKLIYLIEHPEIWPEMGRAGRAHVEANYDINKLNDRLVEIYQQLLHT